MSNTKPRYAYADESGDAGYDFGANSSSCFVMGIVLPSQPEHLVDRLLSLRRALRRPETFEFHFRQANAKDKKTPPASRSGKPSTKETTIRWKRETASRFVNAIIDQIDRQCKNAYQAASDVAVRRLRRGPITTATSVTEWAVLRTPSRSRTYWTAIMTLCYGW